MFCNCTIILGPETSPILKVLTPKKGYSPRKVAIDGEEQTEEDKVQWGTPRRRIIDTPKCRNLKKSLQSSAKIIKRQKNKYIRLKKKIEGENVVNLNKFKFKSETSKVFTNMQFRKGKKQWSDEEKKFCMALYYKSPATYNFLLNSGVILAAPTTIKNWLQETNCLPGLNDDLFNNIKQKFLGVSLKERACTICFDEMSIKVDLEYTKKYDFVEGFEDFGGGERSNLESKYALVFVARGVYNNWKIPLAYFLSNKGVDSDKLIMIIKSVINKLFDCGLLPKVCVCDQATTNVRAMKLLGATKDDPFFFCRQS